MEPGKDIHEEDPPVHHCTFTLTVTRFSGDEEAMQCDDETFGQYYTVKLHPKGSAGNEGYVSILFFSNALLFGHLSIEFSCVASVVDASGEKRFPQTFTYDSESSSHSGTSRSTLGFERYIGRGALRGDLLPNDSLTVCLDIDYDIRRRYSNCAFENTIIRPQHFQYFIPADSAFGREVCRWSEVFRRMGATPMLEGLSGRLPVLHEEIATLELLSHVVAGSDFIVRGVDQIRDLYVLADKYDMPAILHECRQLLLTLLRVTDIPEALQRVAEDMHLVSELRELIRDERLHEIVAIYSRIQREGLTEPIARHLETEWICKYERNFLDGSFFKLSKVKNEYLRMDFYK